jgi:hypothetical protein
VESRQKMIEVYKRRCQYTRLYFVPTTCLRKEGLQDIHLKTKESFSCGQTTSELHSHGHAHNAQTLQDHIPEQATILLVSDSVA